MSEPNPRDPMPPNDATQPEKPTPQPEVPTPATQLEAPTPDPDHPDAPSPLVSMPADPGRAALAAVLLVLVTDVCTFGGAWLMRKLETAGQPGAVQSAALGSMATLGYLLGLAIAVALTRSPRGDADRPRPSFAEDYGFRGLSPTMFGWALIGALTARLLGGLWALALQAMNVKLPGMDVDPSALLPKDPVSITIAFVLFAGLAPLVEEIGFRGIVYGSLERRIRPVYANLVTALLFGALHFNVFGFVPIVIASLAFGVLFRRTRSLWTAVFSHAAFNALGLTIAYLVAAKPGA